MIAFAEIDRLEDVEVERVLDEAFRVTRGELDVDDDRVLRIEGIDFTGPNVGDSDNVGEISTFTIRASTGGAATSAPAVTKMLTIANDAIPRDQPMPSLLSVSNLATLDNLPR